MIKFRFDENEKPEPVKAPVILDKDWMPRCYAPCDEYDFIDRGDYKQMVCGITNMPIDTCCPRGLWYSGDHPRLLTITNDFPVEDLL